MVTNKNTKHWVITCIIQLDSCFHVITKGRVFTLIPYCRLIKFFFFKSNNSSKDNAKMRHETLQEFFVELLTSKGLTVYFTVIHASLPPIPCTSFTTSKFLSLRQRGSVGKLINRADIWMSRRNPWRKVVIFFWQRNSGKTFSCWRQCKWRKIKYSWYMPHYSSDFIHPKFKVKSRLHV